MDPLGFAFENFNAVGGWRDKDGEFAVDPSGVLPDGQTFNGPDELKLIMREQGELFVRCIVDHARAGGAFLTGAQPKKTAGVNFQAGQSADQFAALRLGDKTRLPSLELVVVPSVFAFAMANSQVQVAP